jgi:hypothetical protein
MRRNWISECFFGRGRQQRRNEMKSLIAVVVSLLIASPVFAQVKPCEELKSEIETKITNNGVKVFTLTIVDKDQAEDGKVVGTCDGGAKKIVYKRGS